MHLLVIVLFVRIMYTIDNVIHNERVVTFKMGQGSNVYWTVHHCNS